MKDEWRREASAILKAELKRRETGYKALVKQLERLGVKASQRQLTNKINRGTFSFVFFLKWMKAIDTRDVNWF